MQQSENRLPEWYWNCGLHDAKIISAINSNANHISFENCLILKIDCNGAMFEKNIKEIRFYGYKIKTLDFDVNLLNGGWWLSDKPIQKGNHYVLDLKFSTAKCKTKRFEISFQAAKVIKE